MAEVLTLGEPIVTFASTDIDQGLVDSVHYYKLLGGAELNVMIGTSRLGHSTEYISQVGEDALGKYAIKNINKFGVGTSYISSDASNWTAFQLKELVSIGDPKTFNFRKNSAASHLEKNIIDSIDLEGVKMAHLSGIFPAISKTTQQTFEYFAQTMLNNSILTTFDPNLRPALWESKEKMVTTINQLAKYGNIVMPGIDEGEILMGSRDPEAIADFYLQNSDVTQTVIVKIGPAGAYVKTKTDKTGMQVAGFKVDHVVDTVGAGDGFALGVITGLLDGLDLKNAVERGNAVGALQVQTPGDNDGYPTVSELKAFMDQNKGE